MNDVKVRVCVCIQYRCMRQDQGRSWDAFSNHKNNYSFIFNN
jgi:hypothetical protein